LIGFIVNKVTSLTLSIINHKIFRFRCVSVLLFRVSPHQTIEKRLFWLCCRHRLLFFYWIDRVLLLIVCRVLKFAVRERIVIDMGRVRHVIIRMLSRKTTIKIKTVRVWRLLKLVVILIIY